MYGFLPVEAMASTLPFSMIGVAGHVHSLGFSGNIGQTGLSLLSFGKLEWVLPPYTPYTLSVWVKPQNDVSGNKVFQILGHSLKSLVGKDLFLLLGH